MSTSCRNSSRSNDLLNTDGVTVLDECETNVHGIVKKREKNIHGELTQEITLASDETLQLLRNT